jgi:hypothetical protein
MKSTYLLFTFPKVLFHQTFEFSLPPLVYSVSRFDGFQMGNWQFLEALVSQELLFGIKMVSRKQTVFRRTT